jgi:glycosyltransferase involved in cell wall biosynthesis
LLFQRNIITQDYPHELLTLIIDDDGTDPFIRDGEMESFRESIKPIKLKYLKNNKRRNIGEKRHNLIKNCDTDIFCFLDDDDLYYETYIRSSYEKLKTVMKRGRGCVGCDKMLFCMTDKDYSVHAIDCGNNKALIHEATIMATKKWYKASCGFERSSRGEGKQLFTGIDKNVGITDIKDIMLCLQHSENTVDKLQFARDDNKLNIEISDELKMILDKIFCKESVV